MMQSEIKLYCTELLLPMTAVYPLQRSFCCFSHQGHLNLRGILTFFYFSQLQESSPVAAYPPDSFAFKPAFLAQAVLCVLLLHESALWLSAGGLVLTHISFQQHPVQLVLYDRLWSLLSSSWGVETQACFLLGSPTEASPSRSESPVNN